MDHKSEILKVIKQLTIEYSEIYKRFNESHIKYLTPINTLYNENLPPKRPQFSFWVNKVAPSDNRVILPEKWTMVDSELFYQYYKNLPTEDFIERFNKTFFNFILDKFDKTKNLHISEDVNIWYKPKIAFINWFQENGIDIDTISPLLTFEQTKSPQNIIWREHSIAFFQYKDSVPFARLISPNVEDKALTHPLNLGLYKSLSEPTAVYGTLLMFANSGKTLNPRDYPDINMNAWSKRISRCNEWLMEKFKLDEKPISAFSKKRHGYTIKIKITLENRGGGKDAMDLVDDNYSNPDSDSLF